MTDYEGAFAAVQASQEALAKHPKPGRVRAACGCISEDGSCTGWCTEEHPKGTLAQLLKLKRAKEEAAARAADRPQEPFRMPERATVDPDSYRSPSSLTWDERTALVDAAHEAEQTEEEPSPLERLRAALLDTDGLDSIPDPVPLIGDDILFVDSINWMVGKPGCMKSFTALDMAGCVGTGEMWQGYRVKQGTVLYLVAEGVRGTKKRVRAWEKAAGRDMTGVQFLPVAVQSKDAGQWRALVELAAELQPVMVVLDTQARITVGVEENSNAEMGEFVHRCERLREASGACVLIVHHIGRNGDTGRGATTLDGALSTIIKVTKDDDHLTLECQKNKDGTEWDPIQLRAVLTGDSLTLTMSDGPGRLAAAATCAKWLKVWWDIHGDEPVSISVLVKSGVVAESTFHRQKRALIEAGSIVREGRGSATRYRLRSATS